MLDGSMQTPKQFKMQCTKNVMKHFLTYAGNVQRHSRDIVEEQQARKAMSNAAPLVSLCLPERNHVTAQPELIL